MFGVASACRFAEPAPTRPLAALVGLCCRRLVRSRSRSRRQVLEPSAASDDGLFVALRSWLSCAERRWAFACNTPEYTWNSISHHSSICANASSANLQIFTYIADVYCSELHIHWSSVCTWLAKQRDFSQNKLHHSPGV